MTGSVSTAIIRRADKMLADRYRTPGLGNKRHPVSELVFIVLSARTRGEEHEAAYHRLRSRFKSWQAVRDASLNSIAATIRDAGLSRVKAKQIKGLLKKITKDFGSLSGSHLRRLPDRELETYLTSLPGVGLKTARCVMLYSLDRDVFPVDTHCRRLFENLGIVNERLRFEYAQNPLQSLVPTNIRYSLHVNAVAHGRATCLAGTPRCTNCPIHTLCQRAIQ